jgi:hypothetical protein
VLQHNKLWTDRSFVNILSVFRFEADRCAIDGLFAVAWQIPLAARAVSALTAVEPSWWLNRRANNGDSP